MNLWSGRLRLVIIAVDEYEYETPEKEAEFTTGIRAQVAEVERWWAEPDLGEGRKFTVERPETLADARDLDDFLHASELEESKHDDVLVIYVTGHGIVRTPNQHFLLLPKSDKNRLVSTARRTADLIERALESESEHVLVMVDSCYSGILASELSASDALRPASRKSGSLMVLTAGGAESKPYLEEFTTLLREVRELCGDEALGMVGPYISIADFARLIRMVNEKKRTRWEMTPDVNFVWPTPSSLKTILQSKPSPCLPNPAHIPSLSRSYGDLDPDWLLLASGSPRPKDSEEPAWFFTERVDLLRSIAQFLRSERGTLVVTGTAGSGKSALLARAVTLAHGISPGGAPSEDIRVLEGSVNAAVFALGMSVNGLALAMWEKLWTEVPVPQQTPGTPVTRHLVEEVARCSREGGPLITIVIDGIDEAVDPERLVTDLIRPLAELRSDKGRPCVRLLLSVRSIADDLGKASGLRGLLTRVIGVEFLSTDDSLNTARKEIEKYVLRLLQDSFKVGERSSQLNDLARVIAQEVAPSFLDARFAAEQLRRKRMRSHLPDPSDQVWREQLRQGTENALRRDLDYVSGATEIPIRNLVTVLRCTAFAQGKGLPWAKVWPTVLQRVYPDEITVDKADELIGKVLHSRLAGYLLSAEEDGRRVYRPMHERLGELLRTGFSDFSDVLIDPIYFHEGFAKALHSLWESEGGSSHPYTLRHLVAHAALGGVLSDTVVPADFLPHEKGRNVRGSLGLLAEHTKDTTVLSAWACIEPWMADASADTCADSLSLVAHGFIPRQLIPPSLAPLWTDTAIQNNPLFDGHQGAIGPVVSFRTWREEPRVAVGDTDGRVRIWDVSSGTTVGPPIRGPWGAAITALAALTDADDRSWLAVGSKNGAWLYCLGGPDNDVPEIVKVPESDRRGVQAMLVVPGTKETERLEIATDLGLVFHLPWQDTSEEQPALETGDGAPVGPLAFLDTGEQRLLAMVRLDRVEVLDADSRQTIVTIPEPDHQITALVLYSGRDGRPQLVSATCSKDHTEGIVRVRDALSGQEKPFQLLRLPVTALIRFDYPERETLIGIGGPDGSVRLWNPQTGEEYRRFPVDHTGGVTGLAVVPGRDEVPVLVSGSADRTLRLWNPEAGESVWRRPSGTGDWLVPLPRSSGKRQLLVLETHGLLGAMSAADGERGSNRVEPPVRNAYASVTALAVHPAPDGELTIVAGLPDGTVALHKGRWGSGEGSWTMTDIAHPGGHATAFTFFEDTSGRTVLAAGMNDGGVIYCDLVSGDMRGPSFRGADAPVRGLAVLRTPETLLAVASDDVVRLCRPFQEPHLRAPDTVGAISSLAVSTGDRLDGGDSLIMGDEAGEIRWWSPGNPEIDPVLLSGHRGSVSALAVLPSEAGSGGPPLVISAGARDTTVRVWDASRRREVKRLVTGMSLTSLCALGAGEVPGVDAPLIVFGGPAGSAAVTLHHSS